MLSTPKAVDVRWLLPLVIALLSLAVSGYAGYTANDRETVQRVATAEAHLIDDRKGMDEIKATVKETNATVTEILILLATKH